MNKSLYEKIDVIKRNRTINRDTLAEILEKPEEEMKPLYEAASQVAKEVYGIIARL